jgi:hypothetical protein
MHKVIVKPISFGQVEDVAAGLIGIHITAYVKLVFHIFNFLVDVPSVDTK